MMKYNFDRVFKARGIDRPFTYLKNAGFTDNMAVKINRNRVDKLSLIHMEQLCMMLRCTPNDFIVWESDRGGQVEESHPIFQLKRNEDQVEITQMLNGIPLGKLAEIKKLIQEQV